MGAEILPLSRPEPAEPVDTFAAYFSMYGEWRTAITRVWREKSRPTCGGLCRTMRPDGSCPNFRGGVCMVPVADFVPLALCAAFTDRTGAG